MGGSKEVLDEALMDSQLRRPNPPREDRRVLSSSSWSLVRGLIIYRGFLSLHKSTLLVGCLDALAASRILFVIVFYMCFWNFKILVRRDNWILRKKCSFLC